MQLTLSRFSLKSSRTDRIISWLQPLLGPALGFRAGPNKATEMKWRTQGNTDTRGPPLYHPGWGTACAPQVVHPLLHTSRFFANKSIRHNCPTWMPGDNMRGGMMRASDCAAHSPAPYAGNRFTMHTNFAPIKDKWSHLPLSTYALSLFICAVASFCSSVLPGLSISYINLGHMHLRVSVICTKVSLIANLSYAIKHKTLAKTKPHLINGSNLHP